MLMNSQHLSTNHASPGKSTLALFALFVCSQMNTNFTTTTDPIILEVMESVWGRSPHPFQLDAIWSLCYP